MDITYIPMEHGFVYLGVVLDWFRCRVLSRSVPICTWSYRVRDHMIIADVPVDPPVASL
jgi:hypothetical protein